MTKNQSVKIIEILQIYDRDLEYFVRKCKYAIRFQRKANIYVFHSSVLL